MPNQNKSHSLVKKSDEAKTAALPINNYQFTIGKQASWNAQGVYQEIAAILEIYFPQISVGTKPASSVLISFVAEGAIRTRAYILGNQIYLDMPEKDLNYWLNGFQCPYKYLDYWSTEETEEFFIFQLKLIARNFK